MTGVTHGADTDRLRQIAVELTGCAQRTRDVAAMGHGSMMVLAQAWQGPDVEHFVHSWDVAGRSIEQAADHLQQTAEALRRQADDQTGASAAGASSGGTSSAGTPPGTLPEPDDGDSDGTFPAPAPGVGFVDNLIGTFSAPFLPPGMWATDPEVLEMLKTPEGRAWLSWLNANDIQVVHGASDTEYDPGENTIYLEDGDASSLVHEASHAKWDAEGKSVDITAVSQEEYVASQIDNEVDAMVSSFEYLEASTDDPADIDKKGYDHYQQARDAAAADGATPEEAQEAGRAAVHENFMNGTYETGNTDESYTKYYGDAWEKANP